MTGICEHEEDYEEDFDFDEPIAGTCFHVLTEFNLNHQAVKRKLQSRSRKIFFEPQATHPQALSTADICADAIRKQFKGSTVKRIEPTLRTDEFHLYVLDKSHATIAKVGVIFEDYRDFTIH